MASYTETGNPVFQAFDGNGDPLSGGKLYTYAAGTSTPLATYTDSTGGTQNDNPTVLDTRGEAPIWRTVGVLYKFVLKTSADVTLWTINNIGSVGVDSSAFSAQTFTAFTTGGTSTAYTLTPSPAIAANAENQRFQVEFHTASGATPTMAVSGQSPLNLKYRDYAGAKQSVTTNTIPSGWRSDVVNDGTDWLVIDVPDIKPGAVTTSGLTMTTARLLGRTTASTGAVEEITAGNGITLSGGSISTSNTYGTPAATTSGSSKTLLSGLAAGVNEIDVCFNGFSTNGTASPVVQLGTVSGLVTAGYLGSAASAVNAGATVALNLTNGFALAGAWGATTVMQGVMHLRRYNGNKWVGSLSLGRSDASIASSGGGFIDLAGEITQVALVTTDTMDAGEVTANYRF